MEEKIPNEIPELQDETPTPDVYVPRPAWQVWAARVGLVIMIIGIALWLYNIAFPM